MANIQTLQKNSPKITLSRKNIALQSIDTFLKIHKISQKDVKLALQNYTDKWEQHLVFKEFSKSSSFCDRVANMCKLCYLVVVIAFQVCMVASSLAMQQHAIFKWYPFPRNSSRVSPLNSRPCSLKFWTRRWPISKIHNQCSHKTKPQNSWSHTSQCGRSKCPTMHHIVCKRSIPYLGSTNNN